MNYTETPGKIIKMAREAKKISLDEASKRLLLSKDIVNAIENDDYSRIPAQVYAEGYLRSYAQFLDISADKLLKSFRDLNVYSDKEDEPQIMVEDKPGKKPNILDLLQDQRLRFAVLGLCGGLVLVLLVVFIFKFKVKDAEIVNDSSVVNIIDSDKKVDQQIPVFTINVSDEFVDSDNNDVQD